MGGASTERTPTKTTGQGRAGQEGGERFEAHGGHGKAGPGPAQQRAASLRARTTALLDLTLWRLYETPETPLTCKHGAHDLEDAQRRLAAVPQLPAELRVRAQQAGRTDA